MFCMVVPPLACVGPGSPGSWCSQIMQTEFRNNRCKTGKKEGNLELPDGLHVFFPRRISVSLGLFPSTPFLWFPPKNHSLEMLSGSYSVSFYTQALGGKERGRREICHLLLILWVSSSSLAVIVLVEPPWVYKHGGNVSHVCETLVKHGRLWSSNPSCLSSPRGEGRALWTFVCKLVLK